MHGRAILFLDSSGMMKDEDFSLELVSAQLLHELVLSYWPLIFVHILGEVGL